ncbi:hypothetical protein GGR58DRAFT_524197 [Xylaria digitata]|nr:hypothetical protein GGR58DRAFT_524197 [Xylaria digitata]
MSTGPNPTGQYPVYVGTWINWSRGQILGGTLTLRRGDADLLIAFTAFFIAFVAIRVWRLICFATHRSCSKETPQNAIYHQHRAILRNSSTPEDGIRLLSYVLWVSKNSTGLFLPLSTTAVATICNFSFTVAGGFSSYISTGIRDEVLIKSMNCGGVFFAGEIIGSPSSEAYFAERVNSAANYAQQCYSENGGGLLDCNRLVTKKIVGNVDRHAACPFHSGLCRHPSSNIRIDSSCLSSYDHFGLNTPPDQRLWWRNVYHCAPMVTTGYTSQINTSFGESTVYHYGNDTDPTRGARDYMYAAKSLETQYSFIQSNSSVVYYANFDIQQVHKDSSFLPIDSLLRDDADIDIHFLSGNGVSFTESSNDPWYRVATMPVNWLFTSFCNSISGTRKCGPLASLRDAATGVVDLFDTTYIDFITANGTNSAAALFGYFSEATTDSNVLHIIQQLGPTSLLSQGYLNHGFQHHLEPDQWQLDIPAAPAAHNNYTTPELKKLCDSQKIRSTAYGSFSLFGLIFIFSVGGSLVATSYLLEPVSAFLYEKGGYKKYEHLEWTSNATLQLQRLAHEEAGFGIWFKCTKTVPGTQANELLGSLDITNPDHPVLQSSGPEQSDPVQAEDASSPTVTPSSRPLHPIHPTASYEGGIELPQTHKLTPNSEVSEATVEPQDSENTDPTHGEQRSRLG